MSSVGSAVRVDGVDLQVMGSAAAFARPQAKPGARPADAEPDTKISSDGKLRSATSAALDAATRLSTPQTWSATTALSDNRQVVQAVSNNATAGDYSVSVDALASAQTTASATFSPFSTVIGIGTLNIELGSWNTSQTAFSTNPNWPKASVTVGPKDTSLEQIRDRINAAGIGVIATVLSDATGSRLILRSTSTGSGNGFKVSAEPNGDANGKPNADTLQALSALGFDPSAIHGGNATLVQPAQDAQLKIDGRRVQSAQNLVEDTASGLSLRLNDISKGDVSIRVRPDTPSLAQHIQAFANAYNDMSTQLTHLDPNASDASVQAARDIQQRVQDAFKPDTDPRSLSSQLNGIGLHMTTQGTLTVDDSTLAAALDQGPGQVQPLFAREGVAGESSAGLTKRLQALTLEDASTRGSDSPAATPGASPDSAARTAGAAFRQKLLEQYVPLTDAGTRDMGAAKHEDEAAMPANAG